MAEVQDTAAPVSLRLLQRLRREAELLQRLWDAYRQDRQFLTTPQAAKRPAIFVFLDSHEVRAYIDPDAPGSLTGFITALESEVGGQQRRTTIALRHDQILNGFLFDPARACGILPSHSEEMEREVSRKFDKLFDVALNLVRQAKQQIQKNRTKATQYALAAENARKTGIDAERATKALVAFFQDHAPALVAVLRDNLSTSYRRFKAVLDNSGLTLWNEIEWSELGIDQQHVERLQNIRPSFSEIQALREQLEHFDRRRNTEEANHVDAAALIQVRLLRDELKAIGATHLRVVLVSRAQTFLRLGCDMADATGSELLVRHPRMIALTAEGAETRDEVEEATLGTALRVWRDQVDRLPAEPSDPELIRRPAEAFVGAWDAFESSRLAMEARSREGAAALAATESSDAELAERLIRLFREDQNVDAALNQTLLERFKEFSKTSSRLLLVNGKLDLKARLIKGDVPGRISITPLMMGSVGPLFVADWPGSPRSGSDLVLGVIADAVLGAAERPLVWALALACAGRWRAAGQFARSALQLAQLEHDPLASDEARLLRAEIRRLGSRATAPAEADDEYQNPTNRWQRCVKDLSTVTAPNAPRRLREEAAQLLDAALSGVAIPDLPDAIRRCFADLDAEADTVKTDETKARCIALLLMLYLYDARRIPQTQSAFKTRQRQRARSRLDDLSALLKRLRAAGQADAMPHRARAMEVIGYVLFDRSDSSAKSAAVSGPGAKPATVPHVLHGEFVDLRKGLQASSDQIASFLGNELATIEATIKRLHNPEVALAPVAFPEEIAASLRDRYPVIMRIAEPAMLDSEAVGWELLERGPESADEARLRATRDGLERALELARQATADPHLLFYVKIGGLYPRLLDATFQPLHVRDQRFRELAEEYREVCTEFPHAVLPRLRLSYLADKLDDQALYRRTLEDAMACVDHDRFFPVTPGGPHWIQSYTRRAYAYALLRDCPDAIRPWPAAPHTIQDDEAVAALRNACTLLLHADVNDRGKAANRAHTLERERRTNNIIYYGTLLIERSGREAFGKLSPGKTLDDFVRILAPAGIDGMTDLKQLHTIGCYQTVVGNTAAAHTAGRQILRLSLEGKQMGGADPETCVQDALMWFNAGKPAEIAITVGS